METTLTPRRTLIILYCLIAVMFAAMFYVLFFRPADLHPFKSLQEYSITGVLQTGADYTAAQMTNPETKTKMLFRCPGYTAYRVSGRLYDIDCTVALSRLNNQSATLTYVKLGGHADVLVGMRNSSGAVVFSRDNAMQPFYENIRSQAFAFSVAVSFIVIPGFFTFVSRRLKGTWPATK